MIIEVKREDLEELTNLISGKKNGAVFERVGNFIFVWSGKEVATDIHIKIVS